MGSPSVGNAGFRKQPSPNLPLRCAQGEEQIVESESQ